MNLPNSARWECKETVAWQDYQEFLLPLCHILVKEPNGMYPVIVYCTILVNDSYHRVISIAETLEYIFIFLDNCK